MSIQRSHQLPPKFVYFFSQGEAEGNSRMRNILGGKGANLAEMTSLGLPVPPGFTISAEICQVFDDNDQRLPDEVKTRVLETLERVETVIGKKFGDSITPLLVSVRSGARVSMPGMMDTILNLGLNDETVEGLARQSGDSRFAWDSYRRFLQMYSNVVLGVNSSLLEVLLEDLKDAKGYRDDTEMEVEDLKSLVDKFKRQIVEETGVIFSADPMDQLWGAISAVFKSWNTPRAQSYRQLNGISNDWGTAVNVQSMVFGNMGEDSATGVAFTRNPSTGEKKLYGEFLLNAQGEDVVAGIRTPLPLTQTGDGRSMKDVMPESYKQLVKVYQVLESHYRDMQDIEFTIERGHLWMLQTRSGQRTAEAAIRIAVEMVRENLIGEKEALLRVDPKSLDQLLHPRLDPDADKTLLTEGLPASPGGAVGRIVFSSEKAVAWSREGEKTILVRTETSPEDIEGMVAAEGILTSRGGMTSHAAVVARGMGKCCVAGCAEAEVDESQRQVHIHSHVLNEGDWVTLDGSTGEIFLGKVSTTRPELSGNFEVLMGLADKYRTLRVRTNVETPHDARVALDFGAEGIGLCRTEHMFFGTDRIDRIREMIMADHQEEREVALRKLLPIQRKDFCEIFKVMKGLPVTIRLLDPPLHEFLPHTERETVELAERLGRSAERLKKKMKSLRELNPMLGHRGCRLAITYPEIYQMQSRAIAEAVAHLTSEGETLVPEIMIPLVGTAGELERLRSDVVEVIKAVQLETETQFDYLVGTMIELPRAALTANRVAEHAQFFSFGTNDLTQTCLGISRDDAGHFLATYISENLLPNDPFASIDIEGVGKLVRTAVELGRQARPDIKLGICGEHGGDPESIQFFQEVGLDYISCSPFRCAHCQAGGGPVGHTTTWGGILRIKKLDIVGFKSFKDRTVIHFDRGITGIVGPNGCGKSNIVDALIWVMGEMSAKHLRGSSMADVIFAGAEDHVPLGLADVSLTLENDGGPFPSKYSRHSEVMVTRRLHRSGETEYLINKEPARLRDIQEIFMDTGAGSKGFSIIEQGRIGEIITAKPEQRRALIEEVAGITKFKVRKRESQRKLTSTDQNLVRLQDIIGEQKRQLDSLQRQAQRAARYRHLKKDIQGKEMWLNSKKYLELHEEKKTAERVLREARENLSHINVEQREVELQKIRLKVSEKETQVNELQGIHQKKKENVRTKEDEIREVKFEIEQARRDKEMAGSVLQQYKVRERALTEDKNQLDKKISVVHKESERLLVELEEKNTKYQAASERIEQVDDELTEKRREMLVVSSTHSHLEAKKSGLEAQLEQAEVQWASASEVAEELKAKRTEFLAHRKKVSDQLEGQRQLQLSIMKDVENFEANALMISHQREAKREESQQFKDRLNEVTSRLYGLENLQDNFEGFQEGVKSVMLWQRQKAESTVDGSASGSASGSYPLQDLLQDPLQDPLQVSFCPVSEIVEVPEEYELVMEAALGNRLQVLLSEDQEGVLQAVDYLKEQKTGRSSFLSKKTHSHKDSSSEVLLTSEPGVKSLLSDVVSIPEPHRYQVAGFTSDVVVVDSIRTALDLRSRYKDKAFVTMDGDTLSADGVLTGGAREGAELGLLKRRREIKELSVRREEATGKLALAQASLKKLEAQYSNIQKELESAKQSHNEQEIRVIKLMKDFERAETEVKNSEEAVRKQSEVIEGHRVQVQNYRQKQGEVLGLIGETIEKKQHLEATVESLTQELHDFRNSMESLQSEVTERQVKFAAKEQEVQGLEHQLGMVKTSLEEVHQQLAKMSEESDKSRESLSSHQILIEQSQVELECLIREAGESEKILSLNQDEYEELSTRAREMDDEVCEARRVFNEHNSQINEAQLKLEQLRMKSQYLVDQVQEKYMLDLKESCQEYRDVEGDVKVVENELDDLKAKLKRIGEVNLSAIEEYDDLVDRYEFLSRQHRDLIEARDQLRKVIERINRICTKRFRETFKQVNEKFMKVFPILFGGGEAQLTLVEDPEKDEIGVDIVARPPGKKLQNVSLLSGGEKALSAVSLIFSIFLVKPSPFCLLDEVDAPLDDANVLRFNDLVREMAKRSQIIVVTHNKYTMRVNNKLFGVTMEEKGVSKMVSVSLSEAEKVVQ